MIDSLRSLLRAWTREPLGTAAVALSLALGIGVVTTAYALFQGILAKPFPYDDPTRLVYLWGSTSEQMRRGLTTDAIRVLSSSDAFAAVSLVLPPERVTIGNDPRTTLFAMAVDGTFLRLLGVRPFLGRGLSEAIPPVDEHEVLLSFNAWRAFFAERRDIVGTPVVVGGTTRIVVGVTPAGFFFPDPTVQLWIPHRREQRNLAPGQMAFLAIGRLAPGRSLSSARAEVSARARASQEPDRVEATSAQIGVFPLMHVVVSNYRVAVWSLTAASSSLLLLVVANVCTLVLVRVDRRRTEFAIRGALGASARQLYLQLLCEQLVVTAAAGVVAVPVAQLCLALAKRVQVLDGSRVHDVALGMDAWLFLVVVGVVVFPLVGLVPLRSLRSGSAIGALKTGAAVAGSARRTALRALVLCELVVTPSLLLAASLFFSSFVRMVGTRWGFQPSETAMIELEFPKTLERQLQPQIDLTEQAMRSIASFAETAAVGMGYSVPIKNGLFRRGVRLVADGRVFNSETDIGEYRISEGYFRALGAEVVHGREFNQGDTTSSPRVVVLNESAARLLFHNGNPIGRDIRFLHRPIDVSHVAEPLAATLRRGTTVETVWTVIGVVADVRMSLLEGVRPSVYVDYRQQENGIWFGTLRPQMVVRRRPGSALPLDRIIRRLQAQFSDVRIREAAQMDELLERSLGTQGSRALLSLSAALLTAIAVVLMGLGIYVLCSETLSRRERECGIRMALGASPWMIVTALAREIIPLFGVGVALGVLGSFACGRVIRAYLPSEPAGLTTWFFAGVTFVSTLGAAVAGPVRRALRLEPARLLRSQ